MIYNTERTILLGMVSEKITKLKPKCRKNKLFFQWMTAGTIVFSAAITLVVGLDWPDYSSTQKNIALLLGLILTLLNGWMAVFDYKKLWMRQKATLFGLYLIENELKILNDDEKHCVRIQELFKSYQSVWEKDGSEWSHIYSAPIKELQRFSDI